MSQRLAFILSTGFALGFVVSGLQGCVEPNPDHCVHNDGDAYCAEQHPDWDTAYCSDNSCVDVPTMDGCHEELPLGCHYCDGKPAPECSDMAGDGDGDMTGDGDGDGDSGDGDGDSGDGDGDGETDTPCAGPEDCSSPDVPFCELESGICVDCEGTMEPDAACSGLDAAAPVCVAGSCVACAEGKEEACVETTPVCDTTTNTCVACSEHAQCGDTACNYATGACFDPANIRHVAGSDLDCDNNGDGSELTPFCDIGSALINAPLEPLIILHALNEDAAYQEDTVVLINVALFAAESERPRLVGVNNNPAITVGASGALLLRGVQITGTNVFGFRVNGGSAWVEQARIVNNDGGGVTIEGGGTASFENCFIGGDVNDRTAVDVGDGALSLIYSTVVAGFGASVAVRCDDGSSSSIRNSLIVSRSGNDELQCPSVEVSTSALEQDLGGSNTALPPVEPAWFVPDFNQGDFSLAPGAYPAALETTAIWLSGDPAADIDGDPRPDADGSEDFAGADRL